MHKNSSSKNKNKKEEKVFGITQERIDVIKK